MNTSMKKIFILSINIIFFQMAQGQNPKLDSANLKRMSNLILTNYQCYHDLHDLCKQIGHRLSGSPQAEQAVIWAKSVL